MEPKRKYLTAFFNNPWGNSPLELEIVFEDGEYYGTWDQETGDLLDGIENVDDLLNEIGEYYYESLKDYVNDNYKSVKEYFEL